jgi:uncharacterized OB-fold protein
MSGSPLDMSSGTTRLVGGRCSACSAVMFPLRKRCAACAGGQVARMLLPTRGTLWTYTVQRFMPPSPPYRDSTENFTPFGVGYVQLDDIVRVESRLIGDPETFRIGMALQLVPLLDTEGEPIFAFAPVHEEACS